MATNKNAAGSAGVFDVSHPKKGTISTHSSSKPILITNHPVIHDDVVNENAQPEPTSAPPLTRPKRVVITPLSEADATVEVAKLEPKAEPAPAEPEADVAKPAENTVVAEPEKPAPPEAPAAEIKDISGEPVKELNPEPAVAVPNSNRDDKQLSPAQADEALKLSQERAAKLQHMIENEQYFLPINAVEQRRSRRFAILGLILVVLLAAAWYDTALDAGLVPNTYNLPHTSFFTVK